MAITLKKFVAAHDFRYAGVNYKTGDPVTNRRHIAALVRYGDRFVRSPKTKPAPAETADSPDAATTTSTVSIKEDS